MHYRHQLSAHQYYLDRVFVYALTVKGAKPQNRWLHSLHSVQSAKNCIRSIKRKQLLLEAGVCMAFYTKKIACESRD